MEHRVGLFDRQRGVLFHWVPVAYGIGIGIYFGLRTEPDGLIWVSLALGLAIAFVALIVLPNLRQYPLFIGAIFVALGCCVAGARTDLVAAPKLTFRYYGPIEGRIIEIDRSQSDAPRLTLDHVRLLDVAPERLPTRVRVSLHGSQGFLEPYPGQFIAVTGHLSPPSGPVEPGGYDFRRHAWFQGIGAVGYTRTPALEMRPPGGGSLRLWVAQTRHRLSTYVQNEIGPPAGGFAAAITTGDRSAIPRSILEDLRATNLAHLLAISGLHMGLLTGSVFAALRFCFVLLPGIGLRYPVRKWAAIAAIGAGAGYLVLSGGSVATERAFVMASVMFGAVLLDRRAITLRAVALAAMIVLTLRPEALVSPGFQMSFAATTALVASYGALRDQKMGRHLPKALRWLGGAAFSSLIAGLATAPFAVAHFNQIPHYGLIANVLSVPVMALVVMPSAVLSAVLAPLGLQGLGLWGMELGIEWILWVATHVADWPGALSLVPAPPAIVLPMLTLGALWGVLWQGRVRWLSLPIVLSAFWIWSAETRPDILIADTGGLVGVMTEDGRVLSKPRGDGFAADVWMENDGDDRDQAEAAETWARFKTEFRLLHATGRNAADVVRSFCHDYPITVTSVDVSNEGCEIYDRQRLFKSGAVAIHVRGDGSYRIETVAETSGDRPWTVKGQ